ncbi:hypothetical protein GCM10010517_57410 [Streptosporangium fragile]|uniref:Uncharacterized protein n=1 Tax=Streptosporangium fragile TaxID=46186 RepID=A0ABP6IKV7_9ACTN
MTFNGILSSPVTPSGADGHVGDAVPAEPIGDGTEAGAGAVPVPDGPRSGTALGRAPLARRHGAYVRSRRQIRDGAGCPRRFQPDFAPSLPRW